MRRIWIVGVIILGMLGSAGFAQAAGALWVRDNALIGQVSAEAQGRGIGAVAPHASALKKAMGGATKLFPGPVTNDGTTFILTDGATETAAALMRLAKGKGDVAAFDNPYPVMGLILGSFCVETGKFKDALKALDAGLALSPLPKDRLGTTVPDLLAERGIALAQLKRWKEALANYDAALSIGKMDKGQRALLYRGRGFVLVEMGQLGEAEAAYKASLKFEPGNKIATNELAYIAGLQAGTKPTAPSLTMPGAGRT